MPQKRLAAIDANGTLWIFEIAQTSLAVIGRYGDAASPDGPPVAVSLGDGRPGIVCVSREGLLLVWQDGALRAFDVSQNKVVSTIRNTEVMSAFSLSSRRQLSLAK